MIYAAVVIARSKIFEMFSMFSSFMLENAGPRQIGEPADSLSLPHPKGAEVFGGFLSAGNFFLMRYHSSLFHVASSRLVVSHYASLCFILSHHVSFYLPCPIVLPLQHYLANRGTRSADRGTHHVEFIGS